jgi:hypothetical protein
VSEQLSARVASVGEEVDRRLRSRVQPIAAELKRNLAFAVQDGMTPDDVPDGARIVFVGGSDAFKWRTVETWAAHFPRVHVGRVNNIDRVWQCDDLGIESVDGTGWFKDPTREDKLPALECWLAGIRNNKQMEFAHEENRT